MEVAGENTAKMQGKTIQNQPKMSRATSAHASLRRGSTGVAPGLSLSSHSVPRCECVQPLIPSAATQLGAVGPAVQTFQTSSREQQTRRTVRESTAFSTSSTTGKPIRQGQRELCEPSSSRRVAMPSHGLPVSVATQNAQQGHATGLRHGARVGELPRPASGDWERTCGRRQVERSAQSRDSDVYRSAHLHTCVGRGIRKG